jgi:hypothetical protein
MDVNNNDFYDYNNNKGMADEDSSLGKGVAHGIDSEVEDEIPDGVPRARTFSLLMGWRNSSEEEEDEEKVAVTEKGDKYEYYDQKDFPTLFFLGNRNI